MHVKHIRFENFSGYLNNMYYYSGYGGMDWNDMYEVQSAFIDEHNWCDTGYNNALNGQGEVITLGTGGFQSHDLYKTFSLVNGTFASAWEAKQPITFYTYTYQPGQGLVLKASDTIKIGQNAKNINFDNYGTDFKHISAISFVSGVGNGGSTCSYGTPTYGYIFVMDNLNVKWDRGGAGKDGAFPHAALPHRAMHHTPNLGAHFSPLPVHDGHEAGGESASHAASNHASLHAELVLPGHEMAALTSHFALPQAEHFGT